MREVRALQADSTKEVNTRHLYEIHPSGPKCPRYVRGWDDQAAEIKPAVD
jgi:hypothetical protein